jgi:putative nucleotidyltransferase with HDIG domain
MPIKRMMVLFPDSKTATRARRPKPDTAYTHQTDTMDSDTHDEGYYVSPDQLAIGLYIFIDLPWFNHPFSFNNFKIRSKDQIHTLRSLGVKRFRYDPDRSDTATFPSAAPPPPPQEAAPPEPPPEGEQNNPALAAKRECIQRLQERREKIGNVEKAFAKAATIVRNINRNLLTRPKECMEEVGELINQMARAFLEMPDLTLHVMGEKGDGDEVYYHGLNTSILSMILAKELGLSMTEGRLLGLGSLVHDIGLMEIPDRVLKKKPEEYTHAETELRKLHCEYGVRIAQHVGMPEVVQRIILEHHEMADGSGYPRGLIRDTMHPLARITSLVNYYDNLCNPSDISKAFTPHEALSLMFAQKRSRFDPAILQILIRSLGVYPPGSIVKLSNDALALVQSVNPDKPLRPWVIIYDPEIPKEEAIMLDLEQEPEINISKAIRPSQLPAKVYDYLSPRRRVTYFFDNDNTTQGRGKA